MLLTPSALLLTLPIVLSTNSITDPSPDADVPVMTETRSARGHMPPILKRTRPLGPVTLGGARGSSFVFTGSTPEGDAPSEMVFTSDGSTIVISHRESQNLILWDAATRAFLGEAPVSGAAQSFALTPDDSTAVVCNLDNDSVSIVDMGMLLETANFAVGTNPGVVRVSPAGDVAAVTQTFDAEMVIIDITSASVVRTITGIGSSVRLSASFEAPAISIQYSGFEFIDDDRAINLDAFAQEAQIINVRTGVVTRIPIANNGRDLSVSLDGTRAAISHGSFTRLVTVIDLTTETVLTTWPTGVDLFGEIVINTDGTKGVLSVLNAARSIDLLTGAIGPSLNTATMNELIATSDGLHALGVGFRGALIDFATGSLVAQLNNAVSTEFGAVSPTANLAAMCSTTFGDDMVVVSTNGALGQLEAFQLSGPAPEGDRCRTGAMSPDASVAVGVSILSDTLTIIDTATASATGFAPLGMRPSGVAITPDGTTAVVANLDSTFASVVDLASATTTEVPISRRAGEVVISPDGMFAYLPVVASGDGVWRIDLTTNTVSGPKILTGNMGGVGYSFSQVSGIALSTDGSKLAVAGSFDDVVTIIDATTWAFERNITVGDFPTFVAFSPDGASLYCSNKNADTVSVIDMTLPVPVVVDTIAVGDQPWQIIDAGDGRLFVNNWTDGAIGVVDLVTGVQTSTIALPDLCTGIRLDADAGLLYASNGSGGISIGGDFGFSNIQNGRLSVIDLSTLTITSSIETGFSPSALSMDPMARAAIVPAPMGDGASIIVLDPGCNEADLAEPFGVLDFTDVLAFLGAFSAMDPAADLAAPFGVFDFSDVIAFLGAFGSGCP